MLISKSNLNNYVQVDDLAIEALADKVTAAGFEVEGIERMASGSNLVIGEVKSCVKHENSDHLHVCEVDIKADELLQIVCGASNVREGLKVIVAQVGAKLPGGEIKAGNIRGVDSNGMLCSLLELGVDPQLLSEQQKNGIEELSADAPVGETNVLAYLGLDDEVLDIGLTPNRNDCLANFAFAKEVAAILDREVTLPVIPDTFALGESSDYTVELNSDNCTYYSLRSVKNVAVKPSSEWMQKYLLANGVNPINNLVDISNYVMLCTGQPLHFYDLDKINGHVIKVVDDKKKEVVTLDEEKRNIDFGDTLIMDNEQPIALAGVMGLDNSKVDENTTNILIEVADFNHVAIRNTARKLDLNSDASIRFQKGIEPNASIMAMNYATKLLMDEFSDATFSQVVTSGNKTVQPLTMHVDLANINQRLGTNFSNEAMVDVLNRLDFAPVVDGDKVTLTIPTYRQDITIEADISEEIIRILGFDDLVSTLPKLPTTSGKLNHRQKVRRQIKNILVDKGMHEAITYSLVSDQVNADAIMPLSEEQVVLASPMSEDRKIMRQSILPSLLQSVAYNQKRSIKNVALFELSEVYANNQHQERLSLIISGNLSETRWLHQQQTADFYLVKGLLMSLLTQLGIAENRLTFKANEHYQQQFHPYQSSEVYLGKTLLGVIGRIHPLMAQKYEVNSDCVMLEINLDLLLATKVSKIKFKPISKFPIVKRDLAFVVSEQVAIQDLVNIINRNSNRLISEVEVFDIYKGEHVEAGYQSVALSLCFQANDHTLSDDEINPVIENIKTALNKQFDAELRS